MKNLFLLFTILAALTGCTTKLSLAYEPILEKSETNNTQVSVNAFEDVRENVHFVGVNRNVYYMPIVKIITEDNVSEWVTNALKLEMSNAGYSIVNDPFIPAYEVKGVLLEAFTSTYFIYHGKMQITISVQKDSKEVFAKTYLTKESGGINWFARNKSCAKTLELNLQEICKQFINDFNATVLNSDL